MIDVAGELAARSILRGRIVLPRLVVLRRPELIGWIAIGLMALATPMLMAWRGLSFDWSSARAPLAACGALMSGVVVYRNWRRDERIATSLAAVAMLIAFSAVGETFSYAVASIGGPLWDATFEAWDKALGLDWRAYLDAVDARPRLAAIYAIAYDSLAVQIIVAAALLGLSGRLPECRRFAHTVVLAGLAAILVSGFLPAASMVTHLGLRAADFHHLDSSASFTSLGPLNALRSGAMRIISLDKAEGIICFPSFHAALGAIFIWAFWSVRWLRWPAVALNGVLVASTPLNGGHYFVDVIAGIVVAGLTVAAAWMLERRCDPVASERSAPRRTAAV